MTDSTFLHVKKDMQSMKPQKTSTNIMVSLPIFQSLALNLMFSYYKVFQTGH